MEHAPVGLISSLDYLGAVVLLNGFQQLTSACVWLSMAIKFW